MSQKGHTVSQKYIQRAKKDILRAKKGDLLEDIWIASSGYTESFIRGHKESQKNIKRVKKDIRRAKKDIQGAKKDIWRAKKEIRRAKKDILSHKGHMES